MEPFVQLSKMHGTNATNNGTGLGLSISKRLATRMNGDLICTPCQLPAPAGHTNPTRPTETDKGDNREGQGCNPHASSSLPIPTKLINPLRAVQAERRNERDGQPGNTQGTLPPRKEEETAEEYVPQDGQQDTTQTRSFWNGGSDCSASEPKRKLLKHRVYDPLLGKHIIPVINDSSAEQERWNF